jgi:hypothetical protein
MFISVDNEQKSQNPKGKKKKRKNRPGRPGAAFSFSNDGWSQLDVLSIHVFVGQRQTGLNHTQKRGG